MGKQVELNNGYLTIGGNPVDVRGYSSATTGRYSDLDVRMRKERKIAGILGEEGLVPPSGMSEGEKEQIFLRQRLRRDELEARIGLDSFTSYLLLLYDIQGKIVPGRGVRDHISAGGVRPTAEATTDVVDYASVSGVNFDELQKRASDAVPSEYRDSIDVRLHRATGGRLRSNPPIDGIEIMVAEDVELLLK